MSKSKKQTNIEGKDIIEQIMMRKPPKSHFERKRKAKVEETCWQVRYRYGRTRSLR